MSHPYIYIYMRIYIYILHADSLTTPRSSAPSLATSLLGQMSLLGGRVTNGLGGIQSYPLCARSGAREECRMANERCIDIFNNHLLRILPNFLEEDLLRDQSHSSLQRPFQKERLLRVTAALRLIGSLNIYRSCLPKRSWGFPLTHWGSLWTP